jgi:hypothetical protein
LQPCTTAIAIVWRARERRDEREKAREIDFLEQLSLSIKEAFKRAKVGAGDS